MLVDGERLKSLVSGAQRQVLLCAPFIKVRALRTVLSAIDERVAVRVVTRWRAAEVASGISDLEVFELTRERAHTELTLLDELHAKLFLADDTGLAGSANLTAAALGWSPKSNVELLVEVTKSDPSVTRLLRRLAAAQPATYATRSAVAAEAASLSVARLDEGEDVSDDMVGFRTRAWFPSCAAPEKLQAVYKDPLTTVVAAETRESGLADLRDLDIPSGLPLSQFEEAVRNSLLLMPAFRSIVDLIPQGLSDSAGTVRIMKIRRDQTHSTSAIQWRIVRDWISVFFRDEFEVAPDSFVVRLRAKATGAETA